MGNQDDDHRFESVTGFDLIAGRIVIGSEGILLDTCAPVSFSRTGQLSFLDEVHRVPTSDGRKTVEDVATELRSLPGTSTSDIRLDAVVGADLLLGRSIAICWARRSISLISHSPAPEGYAPRGGPLGAIPVVEVGIAGRTVPVVLDTGGARSYLEPELLAGLPRAGAVQGPDRPGEVTSFLYRAPLEMWGRTVEVEFGPLPYGFDVAAVGARGILGTDALARWGDLRLDFPDPEHRRPRGRRYPYVGVRYMAGAYGTRRVHFLASGPASSDSSTVCIVDPQAFERNALTESAREKLIAEVKRSVAGKGFRQCCHFGPHEAIYLEHDGSVAWASTPKREPEAPGQPADLRVVPASPEPPEASRLFFVVGGETVSEEPVARLEADLEALRALGVARLITFATTEELEHLRLSGAFDKIAGHGVYVSWLPWHDLVVPGLEVPEASEAFRWSADLKWTLRDGTAVAIDLRGGRWAEVFAACALVRLGQHASAMALVRAAKPGALRDPEDERFVERFATDAGPRLPRNRRRACET
jgi:hypothetical protein